MTKDIKKSIIALCISIFLFVLALFLLHTFNTLANSSTIIRVVIGIFAVSSLVIGFGGIILFLCLTIVFVVIEVKNKKEAKHNAQIVEKAKNKLPKNVEFEVSISNENIEELNKVLYANIKSTALFDGDKICIKFYFQDEIKLETDILYFLDNFNY